MSQHVVSVAATADGLGSCWLNASPGKEVRTMKTTDTLFSFLYIDAAHIRATNPDPRRFRVPGRMKRLRVSPSFTFCFLRIMLFSSYSVRPRLNESDRIGEPRLNTTFDFPLSQSRNGVSLRSYESLPPMLRLKRYDILMKNV